MIKTSNKKSTGIRNGKWKEFNKRAILISEGVYVKNEKHGVWREYYDDTGNLMIEENYNYGIQHGRFASYHPNGQLLSEGQYRNGLREGYFKIYDEEGNCVKNLLFIHNNEIEDFDVPQASDKERT